MTSGIYQLTFTSGAYYIGKSEDISSRWKQHYTSFEKGTHSKRMQEEFNKYGHPTGLVLLECHKDHIDIMEAIYILDALGSRCLNTAVPKEVCISDRIALLNDPVNLLQYSTATHLLMLNNLAEKEAKLTKKVDKYKSKGIVLPEETKEELDILKSKLAEANKELSYYKDLPLWKRIFSYNV